MHLSFFDNNTGNIKEVNGVSCDSLTVGLKHPV